MPTVFPIHRDPAEIVDGPGLDDNCGDFMLLKIEAAVLARVAPLHERRQDKCRVLEIEVQDFKELGALLARWHGLDEVTEEGGLVDTVDLVDVLAAQACREVRRR